MTNKEIEKYKWLWLWLVAFYFRGAKFDFIETKFSTPEEEQIIQPKKNRPIFWEIVISSNDNSWL